MKKLGFQSPCFSFIPPFLFPHYFIPSVFPLLHPPPLSLPKFVSQICKDDSQNSAKHPIDPNFWIKNLLLELSSSFSFFFFLKTICPGQVQLTCFHDDILNIEITFKKIYWNFFFLFFFSNYPEVFLFHRSVCRALILTHFIQPNKEVF